MPDNVVRAQVRLSMDSGLPEDDVVNTYHFLDQAGAGLQNAHDKIVENLVRFYTHFDGVILSTDLSGNGTITTYNMADAEPRVPIDVHAGTPLVVPNNGLALPSELAICVSWKAPAESGIAVGSRRGRNYIGPLDFSTLDVGGRVDSAAVTSLAEAAEELINEANTDDVPLAIYSPTRDANGATLLDSVRLVDSGFVDNAFDVQRRRGVAASSRVTFP